METARALSDRVLNATEVCQMVGLSRCTLWRLRRQGEFPAHVVLSPRRIGWLESTVLAWVRGRSGGTPK